jgi:hypothetical protein
MDAANPTQSQNPGESPLSPSRTPFADAIRYWELRRVPYNLLLTAVVVGWIVKTWPHFRVAMTLHSLLLLSILALLANLCYCAAYLVDVPLQYSPVATLWRRRRWVLWLVGTLFALLFENYWIADEIYPYVN